MSKKKITESAASAGIPVAPAIGPALEAENIAKQRPLLNSRILFLSAAASGIGVLMGFVAQILIWLISFITNIAFYNRFAATDASPSDHHYGAWVIVIPVIGGIIVGIMARFGSKAIRGHGIPEAMEQVLTNESRIKPAVTFLKPLASAVSIGTGGPFGAEGPIIATGGAFGSMIGQLMRTTADERKIFLAAGATSGMAAIFGTPLAAVMLAIELLMFELSPRAIIPVMLACFTGAGMHWIFVSTAPFFPMTEIHAASSEALLTYCGMGIFIGMAAALISKAVYFIEDAFEKLPIHWMWWPAIGGIAVGLVGYVYPHSMGVGYDNIRAILSGNATAMIMLLLFGFKALSWIIAIGSGNSGGTLAPLFTIGGAFGALMGFIVAYWFPNLGIDPRVAGLIGMAGMFAGASRALLTSIIFAFEATQQADALLPLMGCCTVAYLVSFFMMKNSLMTEKIERRGVKAPSALVPDVFDTTTVEEIMTTNIHALSAENTISSVKNWLLSDKENAQNIGFPVVTDLGELTGVVSVRTIYKINPESDDMPLKSIMSGNPMTIYPDNRLKMAVDIMVKTDMDMIPVVERANPRRIIGVITHKNILSAYGHNFDDSDLKNRSISIKRGGIKIILLGRKLLNKTQPYVFHTSHKIASHAVKIPLDPKAANKTEETNDQ